MPASAQLAAIPGCEASGSWSVAVGSGKILALQLKIMSGMLLGVFPNCL